MNDISVKKINKLIEDYEVHGKKAEILELGYKTYARLMSEDKFADKVTKSQSDLKERLYKKVKIKLLAEKHHLDVK